MLKEAAVLLTLFGLLAIWGSLGVAGELRAELRRVILTPEASYVVLETAHGNLSMILSVNQGIAIRDAVNGTEHYRPTTHDLAVELAGKAGVRKLVIYGLENGTYLGRLVLRDGEVEVRPSDGLAVCMRAGCPVYVARELVGG